MKYQTKLKAYFITGLFTLLPVMATLIVGWFILKFFIGLLNLPFSPLLNTGIPGIKLIVPLAGFIVTVIVILLIGILMAGLIGKNIILWFEELINKVPLMGNIYGSTKQLFEIFFLKNKDSFSRVVLVEYPRKGLYVVGFVTAESNKNVEDVTGKKVINIYLPTSLNIASGFLIIAPEEDVIPLDIGIEDGLKLVISGGFITPSLIDKP